MAAQFNQSQQTGITPKSRAWTAIRHAEGKLKAFFDALNRSKLLLGSH
jgi:hypothetical protein